MRTAQITVFMLVGIVMLVIFGFMFYVSGELTISKIDQELDRSMAAAIDNAALQEYIRSCLEDVSKDALRIATQQGGSIYYTQALGTRYPQLLFSPPFRRWYGDFIIPFVDDGVKINMTFGIAKPLENNGVLYALPPNYPYIGSLYFPPGIEEPYRNYEQAFNLPNLCIASGANAYKLSEVLGVDFTIADQYDNSCESSYGSDSTQKYLQTYITEKVKDCIDLSAFAEDFGFVFTGTEPEVTVFFGNDHTLVSMNYPFEFAVQGREPITKFYRYNTPFDVRLKKLILDAKRIIERDSRDIFFELYLDSISPGKNCFNISGQAVRCLDEGMTLERFVDHCLDPDNKCDAKPYTDVIKITDNLSVIDGEVLSFYFAVENRYPALEPIDESENIQFDLILEEGDVIHFDPIGVDPDEDRFGSLFVDGERIMEGFYTYEGWLQDYRDWFNVSGCQDNEFCYQNYWEYTNRIDPILNPPPLPLMDVQLFLDTGRQTEYQINASDMGAHKTIVKVCEATGLCDWQEINILVYDQPKAVLSMEHHYTDVPQMWAGDPDGETFQASREDPYYLNGSQSTISIGGPISRFEWYDISNIPFRELIYAGPDTKYEFPPSPHHMMDSFPIIFPVSMDRFWVGVHNISLTVLAGPPVRSDNASKLVYVQKCFPHQSTKTLTVPPFPYHRTRWVHDMTTTSNRYGTETDPFEADHLCCLGDYEDSVYRVAGTGRTCYEGQMFGYYFKLPDFMNATKFQPSAGLVLWDPPVVPSETAGVNTPKWDALNDVFEQTIKRQCPDERGNVCTGSGNIYQYHRDDCSDLYYNGLGRTYERCDGPHKTYQSIHLATNKGCISDQNPGSDYYKIRNTEGDTFEHYFRIPIATGICDDEDQCFGDTLVESWTCGPSEGVLIPPTTPPYPPDRQYCEQAKDVTNCNIYNGCYPEGDPQSLPATGCTDPDAKCEDRDYRCEKPGFDANCDSYDLVPGDDDGDLWMDGCDLQRGNACGKTTTSDKCDSVGTFGCETQDSSEDYCTLCDGNFVWLDNSPDQFPDPSFERGKCCGDTDGASITSKYKSATYVACCNPGAGHTCTARTGAGLDCYVENQQIYIGINCVECQASGNWADCPPI